MAKQTINIGTSANDGTGSTLREAFDITNDNFTELYDGTGGLLHKIEGTNFTGSLLIGHSTTGTLNDAQGNVGIGIGALDALTSADNNIAIGRNAGTALTSGVANIAIGHEALKSEDTTGGNVAIGFRSLKNQNSNTSAYNVAIGYNSGTQITTGTQNTLIGSIAGDALTTGSNNVAVGYQALSAEDENNNNVAIGSQALKVLNAGNTGNNVAVGLNAGVAVSTGLKNTILGSKAGDLLTTGQNNTIIGYNAEASAVDVSNEITFGDTNITNVRIPSDSTLKIGASGDLQLEHVSSNSFIKNPAVGDLYIKNQVDHKDIIIRCDDGSGGLDTYMVFDGSNNRINVAKPFKITDNTIVNIGSGLDLRLLHDGTDSKIQNYAGDLIFTQNTDDGDIIFKSDDGSGGTTEYFRVDGDAGANIFSKNVGIGTSPGYNLHVKKSGTNSSITIEGSTNSGANFSSKLNFSNKDISGNDIDFTIGLKKTNNFVFMGDAAANELMRIEGNTGDIGIGTATPGAKLDVNAGADNLVAQFESTDSISEIRIKDNTAYSRLLNVGTQLKLMPNDGVEMMILDGNDNTINIPDSKTLTFGDSDDFKISHGSGATNIINETGHITIQQRLNDGDIVFQCDDGSGGLTDYFRVDGSTEDVKFSKDLLLIDSVDLKIGSSGDFRINHNGANTFLTHQGAGELYIRNTNDDGDLVFQGDDGSGGNTEYFRIDGGLATGGTVYTVFPDNSRATFGNGYDLQIYHDASNSYIKQGAGGHLIIQQETDDGDIAFKSDDGSGGIATYMTIDGGITMTTFAKDTRHNDTVQAKFGDGADFSIQHNGTDTVLQNITGNLKIINSADDADISFQCDDGSGSITEYFRVDGSSVQTIAEKDFRFIDDVKVIVGTGSDLQMYHNSTSGNGIIENNTGDLVIQNNLDDSDVIFKSDNGAGSVTAYITLDGSNVRTRIDREMRFMDTIPAKFGTSGDLEIYHDGSDSIIKDAGTGSLDIMSSHVHIKSSGGTSNMAQFFSGGNSYIYANNVLRIEATTSGAKVYGDLEIENSSDGIILESPNGTRFRITVDNSGNLSTTSL